MRRGNTDKADVIVIGGGLYGCMLALFLRSRVEKVLLVEARETLLSRASYVNQARVHTGFHYPRSFVTARRSLALYRKFCTDFRDAVVDDFQMLYAIPKAGSRVSVRRFGQMFKDMDAPIAPASSAETALFNPATIAGVFRCEEYAFDAVRLRDLVAARMKAAGIRVQTGVEVTAIDANRHPMRVHTAGGRTLSAPFVVDATYGQLAGRGLVKTVAAFKYELAEIALVEPPEPLRKTGITVMDGPFFSFMPFPAEKCHSLTHVRYTPHRAWTGTHFPDLGALPRSHWLHMQRDAARFVPALADITFKRSLFEVKTVLMRNERDDGRPILMERHGTGKKFVTVMGGKIDNIYDLFDAIRREMPGLQDADMRHVTAA